MYRRIPRVRRPRGRVGSIRAGAGTGLQPRQQPIQRPQGGNQFMGRTRTTTGLQVPQQQTDAQALTSGLLQMPMAYKAGAGARDLLGKAGAGIGDILSSGATEAVPGTFAQSGGLGQAFNTGGNVTGLADTGLSSLADKMPSMGQAAGALGAGLSAYDMFDNGINAGNALGLAGGLGAMKFANPWMMAPAAIGSIFDWW